MARQQFDASILTGAAALALSACGGGGGGGVAPIPPPPITPTPTPTPTPSPTPTPTPTPASYAPVIVFPNVTSSTQFAALGYQGTFIGTTAAALIGNGFSVSYDAAAKNYVMDVPASEPGVFQSADASGGFQWTGKLTDPSHPGQSQPISFGAGRSGLEYTASAYYQMQDAAITAGWMAFGLPTPQSGVPLTGSATYTATAFGYGGAYIDGKATLQFDFGAGSLSGTLDLWDAEYDPGKFSYGHFDLTNTVVGSGASAGQFSGELSGGTTTQHGSFNGLFTGPSAQELMARWTATYPNSDKIMYGIWVGKKN